MSRGMSAADKERLRLAAAHSDYEWRDVYSHSIYARQLADIALGRFRWHGLPPSIDERYLELCLLTRGSVLFYEHPTVGRFLVSPWADRGIRNMYSNPTGFNINVPALPQVSLTPKQAVPIWANRTRMPEIDFIFEMADRLSAVDNAIDAGILLQHHPVLIASTESQRLSMVNAFRQVQEGLPVLFGTEDLGGLGDRMTALDLGADKVNMIQLMDLKSRIWQDALVSLGIDSVDQTKRERMIVAEAEGATGQSKSTRRSSLATREDACMAINEMFGLELTVEYCYG